MQWHRPAWPGRQASRFAVMALVVAAHAAVLGLILHGSRPAPPAPEAADRPPQAAEVLWLPARPDGPPPAAQAARRPTVPQAKAATLPDAPAVRADEPPRAPATMAAPPAPTAEEWAFAARYTLKNSKGYRHAWGRQVRSMMGTATEGPEQGLVRLRVQIAPDGRLEQVQVLWSTSATAERLALQAIAQLPPLPPTPTGEPLVFEKTIAFTPFAGDDTPSYRDDCRPDPPSFRNPFAWDGRSPQQRRDEPPPPPPDPQALADCRKQLPPDSIEGASASDQRQLDRWGWRTPRP